jgi:hypothetical protein
VPEDRAFELLELRARLDPQLADQGRPGDAVGGQRVGHPAGAVEREHQQRPHVLAQRVLGGEVAQRDDGAPVAAEREVGLHPEDERLKAQLLQPNAFQTGELGVGQLGERAPTPQGQGVLDGVSRADVGAPLVLPARLA